MSLRNALKNDVEYDYRSIPLSQIHHSTHNVYEEDDDTFRMNIASKKESIRLNGLKDEIILFVPEGKWNEDREYYVIASGHARFEAYRSLYAETDDDKYATIPSKIIREPVTEEMEKKLIVICNDQQPPQKSEKVYHFEINEYTNDYNRLVQTGELPLSESRKDDNDNPLPVTLNEYLCIRLKVKDRTLRKYKQDLRETEAESNSESNSTSASSGDTEIGSEEFTSSDMEYLKTVEQNMRDTLERKVKVKTNKKGNVIITLTAENLNDLIPLLKSINFDSEGNAN